METGRQLLRWALPGWLYFLLLFAFLALYAVFAAGTGAPLRLRDLVMAETEQASLVELFALILGLGIPLGVPLGFLFAQLDAVHHTAALFPLTSVQPDPGWRLLRPVPIAYLRDLAPNVWSLTRPAEQYEVGRDAQRELPGDHLTFQLQGRRLSASKGALWSLLGLFWVSGRRLARADIQLHGQLADILWTRIGAASEEGRVIAARSQELNDREKTLGACRSAAGAAYISAVFVELIPFGAGMVALAVFVTTGIAALIVFVSMPSLRRSSPFLPPALATGLSLAGLPHWIGLPQYDLFGAAVAAAPAALACGALSVLGARWARRAGDGPIQAAFHISCVIVLLLPSLWWIPWQMVGGPAVPEPLQIVSTQTLMALVALLMVWRTTNTSRNMLQAHRLALQGAYFETWSWEADLRSDQDATPLGSIAEVLPAEPIVVAYARSPLARRSRPAGR